MKDLLIYVADADAEGFIRSILKRHPALEIRNISFDIARHPQRDAGMVQSGAELTRMKKGQYSKALLLWDHHGSGRDHRQSSAQLESEIQEKLNSFTWSENSGVVVLAPELECWLWFCEKAIAKHCEISNDKLMEWAQEYSDKCGKSAEQVKQNHPKELFEHIMRNRLKRTISPRDFEKIGELASVKALLHCPSFKSVATQLQRWFPS